MDINPLPSIRIMFTSFGKIKLFLSSSKNKERQISIESRLLSVAGRVNELCWEST
jgi:hypothetical protein